MLRARAFCLVVLGEGKREFEDLAAYEDAQVELLRAFVALEPDHAGGFLFGADGRRLKNRGLDLLLGFGQVVRRGCDEARLIDGVGVDG